MQKLRFKKNLLKIMQLGSDRGEGPEAGTLPGTWPFPAVHLPFGSSWDAGAGRAHGMLGKSQAVCKYALGSSPLPWREPSRIANMTII